MEKIKLVLLAGLLVVAILPQARAQSEREQIDISSRGPQVGETIPDFTLEDQFGRTWTRNAVLAENGTMLVFIRSADW